MSLDKSIALFGAAGLVGSECLRLLLDDGGFSRVMIFTRRPLSVKSDGAADRPKLETHVLDFEQIERHEKRSRSIRLSARSAQPFAKQAPSRNSGKSTSTTHSRSPASLWRRARATSCW